MAAQNDGILVCESDPARRDTIVRCLARQEVEIVAVPALAAALRRLVDQDGFGILIAGLPALKDAPGQTWEHLRRNLPGLTVVGLVRVADEAAGIGWLERGLFDFLLRPDDVVGLYAAVKSALARIRLATENRAFRKSLRHYRTEQAQIARKTSELEGVYDATIENLMTALDLRDVETLGHSQAVAKYTQVLARLLGIENDTTIENIRKGALLHDIGKIAIPDAILKKKGKLTAEEWAKIRLHPALGYGLVKEIKLVKEVGNIILCHHEHFDGTGYPRGLKMEEIPLEARIFALADALDAITAPRPYRKARDFAAARLEILGHRGTQFDTKAVDAFCTLSDKKWEDIRLETTSHLPGTEEYAKLFEQLKG
jgi:putative nucleotidyltransferase with HDIG domain